MFKLVLAVALVLAIIFAVPIAVYATASSLGFIAEPEGSALQFLAGVLLSKLGTALGFVLIFHFARGKFDDRWQLYAFMWWLMFVIGEAGQALGPGYSNAEAFAGIISESIYFPLSAYVLNRLLRRPKSET
jgi:hypothetical protein